MTKIEWQHVEKLRDDVSGIVNMTLVPLDGYLEGDEFRKWLAKELANKIESWYVESSGQTPRESTGVTPSEIREVVAHYYSFTAADLIESKWEGDLLDRARLIAMYLCREMTDLSLPRIAKDFRTHYGEVMTAHRKVMSEIGSARDWFDDVRELTRLVNRLHRESP